MIYYSMESHDMMLYGMMSHGIVWFSLAVQRGVACCSGWLYDESWVCGLDLMLAYAMSFLWCGPSRLYLLGCNPSIQLVPFPMFWFVSGVGFMVSVVGSGVM